MVNVIFDDGKWRLGCPFCIRNRSLHVSFTLEFSYDRLCYGSKNYINIKKYQRGLLWRQYI